MNNYKRVSHNTIFAFGPHYKASVSKIRVTWVNADRVFHKDGRTAEETGSYGSFWVVKVYGRYCSRENLIFKDAKDAFHELRFQLHDYEEDFKVWGEMLP